MPIPAATFSRGLCCSASASSSGCSRWSVRGGCTVPEVVGQQQRGVVQRHCLWTKKKFFTPGLAVEKMSKSRVRIVHCQEWGGGSDLTIEDWTKKLPAKRKALYSHSLPCIEAWLSCLGFVQVKEDRAVWTIERPDWHAQLLLDVTDLYIRYLKMGPGNLERDIERKFSYALSREDLENAILGGP